MEDGVDPLAYLGWYGFAGEVAGDKANGVVAWPGGASENLDFLSLFHKSTDNPPTDESSSAGHQYLHVKPSFAVYSRARARR